MLFAADSLNGAEFNEDTIIVGLVNNMPDAALRSTERQFSDLLSVASREQRVLLRLYSLPGLTRGESAGSYLAERYQPVDELWRSAIDGLIVTGTEPHAVNLADEPYWGNLTNLIEWTASHTISTIWSCLAAHALVLHVDELKRRRMAGKLAGVFTSARRGEHPITTDLPGRWCLPHSRYNDLPEDRLVTLGYSVLAHSRETGADLFVRGRGHSLDVCLQGHPEYEDDTLLREYRRDVGRYLAGESDEYPLIPCGYLDDHAVKLLECFRAKALRQRDVGLLAAFPVSEVERRLFARWRPTAAQIYSNWLSYLAESKRRLGRSRTAKN